MTNYNDRNRQIRAKNLFEEGEETETEQSPERKKKPAVAKSELSAGRNLAEKKPVAARQMPAGKKSVRRDTVAAAATKQPLVQGKATTKGKKNPRQRQEAHRLYASAAMALFVLFVMGWGICQLVRAINLGESADRLTAQPGEQVVDNSANAGKSIDVDKFVNKMLDNVTFDAELNLLEDSVASGMIATAEGTDLRIYMGNGTYSDELVVMTAQNEADAEQNQKNAELHLAEMQRQFSDYIPKEAKKIDNAIKVRCGSYVVVCVTNDTQTAKKTVDAFMKNN